MSAEKILTTGGILPLVLLRVSTVRAIDAESGTVKWVTSYRHLGRLVREDVRELPALVMTAAGELPAKSLVQSLQHKRTPCGLAITSEYWLRAKCVRSDVLQEVYDPPTLSGDVGSV